MPDEIEKSFLQENGTLKNKLGITDAGELQKKSYEVSAAKGLAILQSNFKVKTVDDLNKIHKTMFGDIYDWAGKTRNYDLSKNLTHDGKTYTHDFVPSSIMDNAGAFINGELAKLPEGKLTSKQYANILDLVNDYHPFREGNGRSTKVFMQCLATEHGQSIDYPRKNSGLILAEHNADVDALSKMIKIENIDQEEIDENLEI